MLSLLSHHWLMQVYLAMYLVHFNSNPSAALKLGRVYARNFFADRAVSVRPVIIF